jgi:hypothetical protein
MQKINLELNEAQVAKLARALDRNESVTIQISKDKLASNKHSVVVHPITHSKIIHAKSKGAGVRLTMTPPEILESGAGFMDIIRKIGKAASWVKEKVIDTPFYQQNIRPELKSIVNAATDALSAVAPSAVSNIAKAGTQYLSDKTGAFGLENPMIGVIHTNIKPRKITKAKAAAELKKTMTTTERVTKPRAKKVTPKNKASGSFVIG